jgi:hypothetical protein
MSRESGRSKLGRAAEEFLLQRSNLTANESCSPQLNRGGGIDEDEPQNQWEKVKEK